MADILQKDVKNLASKQMLLWLMDFLLMHGFLSNLMNQMS
jgi:hypothetical protein